MFATDFKDEHISSAELGFTFGGKQVLRRLLRVHGSVMNTVHSQNLAGMDGQAREPIGMV